MAIIENFREFIRGFIKFNSYIRQYGWFKFFRDYDNHTNLVKMCGLNIQEINSVYYNISKILFNNIMLSLKSLVEEGKLRDANNLIILVMIEDLMNYVKTNGIILDFNKFKCSLDISFVEYKYLQYIYKESLEYLVNSLRDNLCTLATQEGVLIMLHYFKDFCFKALKKKKKKGV